ncbi:glycosyltransferase family 2 protein [Xanthomonas sp. A2111]|uniref:Glycosyltransferase family 2 protein n=1 Tax=Xanthomonas hawaiiensis TaxID=3003247 RepID=A0ABU2I8R6_9XANT|nr:MULTISPECIES: glycosyltransferase family 2 protein [unclassified Xanthomonas]MBO9827759.1 glycosyltransferase family 2 protein [Xanthomonas sp. A2111]MBO9872218.1 glycosyltransferase family 2 protein [Xanthomonas sp. D-93]MDS9994152.1 glycosyltransferase family 2 protein [Xanthomonas sp. A2111]WNH45874.1 glycosyltransferase family 2 protein [Xanthomonas sp. A6251]
MIAVLIPAHNEEALIGACLRSVALAAQCAGLHGEPVQVFVALDRCSDGTAGIVAAHGAHAIALHSGNVGSARAAAAQAALAAGARWLACTDADSVVPANWLSAQLDCASDAFCGIVTVNDWADYDITVRDAYLAGECRTDGHPHVHGANLGLSAELYVRCGGFLPLAAHEDVALVEALVRAQARIARRAQPVVVTSARRAARACGGFSDYLKQMERRLAAALLPAADGDVLA